MFACYIIVLKEVLAKHNQELNVHSELARKLNDNASQNWSSISNELDKIGILLDDNVVSLLSAGEADEIAKIFMRIERFVKRLSGDADILKFKDFRIDDVIGASG